MQLLCKTVTPGYLSKQRENTNLERQRTPTFMAALFTIVKEVMQVSIKGWTIKENVAYTYNRIWFSHKKEWNLPICDNMDGPRGYYVYWVSQTEEGKLPYDFIWYVESKKKKQTHRFREQTSSHL